MRIGLSLLVLLLLAGAAAGIFAVIHQRELNRPLAVGPAPVLYTIKPGTTLQQVARDLGRRGILQHPFHLVLYARLHHDATRIKAGEYQIRPGTTPVQLVAEFVSGRVFQRSLTLVEGWTFAEVMKAVRASPYLEHTLHGLDPAQIMTRLGLPGVKAEGMFFPDTYHFPRGTSDLAFLKRAYETMQSHLKAAWQGRDMGLPYQTPYQALILASIVEKETAVPGERPRIAGVFVRRLEKGMRLETDPTVIYGMGDAFDGNLTRRDLEQDTPYNTYVHGGLPPSPISMPDIESIRAALHPAGGDALYFVAKGDGSHHFSPTYAQHLRAVRRYQLHEGSGTAPKAAHR